ncbi:MAG: TetR/AcrR family transcriptional regulator [Acidimicrobiales bacterium]
MSSRLPAPERRSQLLDVALAVFARKGFHDTSMNDVADAAGVTKPVLYQHWGSKHALYLAVLDEAGNRLVETIAKATAPEQNGHDKVFAGFAAYFRLVAEDHSPFQVLFDDSHRTEEFAEATRGVEDAIAAGIAPLITADIEPDHQRLLARAIVGLAETVARHLVTSGTPFDPDRAARQATDLAWSGLRGVRRV